MKIKQLVDISVQQTLARLREPINWFPFPMLLSFGLVLLFIAHVSMSSNPRLGHPANVMSFNAEPGLDTSIWLSVSCQNSSVSSDDPCSAAPGSRGVEIVVTSNDRQVFTWPQNVTNISELGPFIEFLKRRVRVEVLSGVVAKDITVNQTHVAIATDQRLKFVHIRPIIWALAEAGITNYSFETIQPLANSAADGQKG